MAWIEITSLWNTGKILQARITLSTSANGAAGVMADLTLTEYPAGSGQYRYGNNISMSDTFDDMPYDVEVREVTVAGAFNTSTTIVIPRSPLGYVYSDVMFELPFGMMYTLAGKLNSMIEFPTGGYWRFKTNALENSRIGFIATNATGGAGVADLVVKLFNSFMQGWTITGLDSTGWAAFVFTIKRSVEDRDADAILAVRISNPGITADGIITFNGVDVSASSSGFADAAALSVVGVSPDTELSIAIAPAAATFPPSDEGSYIYELTRYMADGRKDVIFTGSVDASRPVRRALTA